MPHQCTECGRTFPDGSKEMLSGCPDCGGNKFQFDPSGGNDEEPDPDASPPDRPGGSVAGRVGRATATVKRWVSGDEARDPAPDDATSPSEAGTDVGATARAETAGDAGSGSTATDSVAATAADDDGTDDDRAYGEWPNPDGADTAGVGKGPEDRRSRSDSPDDPREWPDADDADDAADDSSDERSVDAPASPDRSDAEATGTPSDGTPAPEVDDEGDEDTAQATARSDVVSPDELPDDPPDSGTLGPRRTSGPTPADAEPDPAGPPEAAGGRVASEPESDDRPDLEDLREELNDQFESIKIVEPGQYELNLMELYDREEYIISLQEDGRYVIEVPERWRDED